MSGALFTNNASSTLQSGITSSATNITINTVDAAAFPSPSAVGSYFMITLEDRTQNPVLREICKCTERNGASLIIVRGQENTTPSAFNAGVTVAHRLTAGQLGALSAGSTTPVTLYLGTYSSAPSVGLTGAPLVPGNLYYDSTQIGLFEFNGAQWVAIPVNNPSTNFGVYLGAFTNPPITMNNGSTLVDGTLYYSTTLQGLYTWDGSAWVTAATAVTNVTQQTGGTTTTGTSVFEDITVTDVASIKEIILDGDLVVDGGDLSGTAISQNFPSGNQMQWGIGLVSTNTGSVTFSPAFTGTPYVNVTLYGNALNATIRLQSVTSTGFTVGVEDTDNNLNAVPCSFMWMAVGPNVT